MTTNELGFGRGPLTELINSAETLDVQPWQPFPAITDRAAWQSLPPAVVETIMTDAAAAAAAPWPALPARLFGDYLATGNRTRFEHPYFERRHQLTALVPAAAITGSVDDELVDRLWSLCEETTWCVPAHDRRRLPDPATPVLDLFAAQSGAQLALLVSVLGPALDEVSPVLAERVDAEIRRRVVEPYLAHDDFRWLGLTTAKLNNWNPWVNLNVLISGLTVLTEPADRVALVRRVAASLDAYLVIMPDDGGCTEGQSYWAQAASKAMDVAMIIRDVTGLDATRLPVLVAAARYPVAMHVAGDRMVQHADGSGRYIQDPHLLHRYGVAARDAELQQLACHLRDLGLRATGGAITLWDLLLQVTDRDYHARPVGTPAPNVGRVWFPRTEVLSVRERPGRADGLHLVVKGGHNDEEHNHNDVGSFSIALDGRPVVVDPGVDNYTSKTFGPQRYELWPMRSGWHNLPVINGVEQHAGKEFRATDTTVTESSDESYGFATELAAAWPAAAGVRSWRRELIMDRDGRSVTMTDTYGVPEVTSLELPVVAAAAPLPGPGRTRLGGLIMEHPGLSATVEVREVPSRSRISETWPDGLWRIRLTPERLRPQGSWQLRFTRAAD
ncbi:heparinase II/III domain-containing protein [Propionibacteriaceae bacterium Y2011]